MQHMRLDEESLAMPPPEETQSPNAPKAQRRPRWLLEIAIPVLAAIIGAVLSPMIDRKLKKPRITVQSAYLAIADANPLAKVDSLIGDVSKKRYWLRKTSGKP